MSPSSVLQSRRINPIRCNQGFSLVEMLITILVAVMATSGVYTVYAFQQRGHRNQQLTLESRQNMRGAMMVLEQQIRMAGYDPEGTKQFGITDVRRYDPIEDKEDPTGLPALSYTADVDEDGFLDDRDGNRSHEHYSIRVRQDQDSGRSYLAWDVGGKWQPLAGNIQTIAFAYAIDAEGDGRLDTWADGKNTIWAVDADNDNLLDTHIDANDDGIIDAQDDINGDGIITPTDGTPLNPPVPVDRIKSIRVWVLSKSTRPLKGHFDGRTHAVGDRIIPAAADGFQRDLLEMTIDGRNL